MAALVLLLVYLLLTLLALLYAEGLRRALLTAAVAFGLLLVVITELLSAVRLLSFGWLLNAWLMAALTMVVFIIHAWCRKHAAEIYDDEEHQSAVHTGLASIFRVDFRLAIEALPAFAILLRNAAAVIANRLRGLPRAWCLVLGAWLADVNSQIVSRRVVAADQGPRTKDLAKRLPAIVLLIGVLAVAVATGIIAFTAPPNNYDSMHSHTAKIPYWIQNHSIAQYSTHAVECIRYEPYAGFCILQFQVLSGGDQFANGVQWFSMLGCLIGVSLIAKCLGAQARGQIVAAVLCATLPMGIMQSTSTQVDYVTAFWLVCVVYHLLLLLANPSSWPLTLLLGTSFGLALLTKATNYFFAFPFAIWLAWFLIRHMKGRAILQMLVMAAIVLLVNAPHYARNIATFGHPLGLQTPSVVQKVTSIALGTWDATETSLRLDDAHYGSANMPLLVDDKAPVNQVSFKVTVDEAGLYDLSAVYATAVSCPFDLYINGYRERENVGSEITGGYYVGNLRRVLLGRIYLIKGENTIKLQRDTGPLPHMAGIIISAPTDFADKTVAGDGLKVESLRLKAGGGLVVNSRVVSSFKTEDRGPRTEDRTLRTEEQIRDTEVAPTLQTMPLALASSATGADGSRFHPAIVAMNVGAGDFAPPNGGDSIRRMQRLQKTALCGLQSSLRQQNPPAPCATPFSKGGMLQIADLGSRISDLGPRLPFSSSATLSITPLTLSSVILSGFSGLGPAAAYAASPDGNGVAENGWVEADDVFGEAADTDPTQLLSDLGSELGVDRYSEFSLPWIMSVVSRNVAMQLATSDAQANAEILKAVEAIHTTLGIELNKTAPDRNKGWKNTFFVRQMLDEDIAVNPDHFMLFAVCLVLMLVSGRVVTDWGRTSANNTGAIT